MATTQGGKFCLINIGIQSEDYILQVFPNLAKLADIYFGVPATSASSEQAFSAAGSCINEKRSRLNATTAKKQLFIHDNWKFIEEFLKSAE